MVSSGRTLIGVHIYGEGVGGGRHAKSEAVFMKMTAYLKHKYSTSRRCIALLVGTREGAARDKGFQMHQDLPL